MSEESSQAVLNPPLEETTEETAMEPPPLPKQDSNVVETVPGAPTAEPAVETNHTELAPETNDADPQETPLEEIGAAQDSQSFFVDVSNEQQTVPAPEAESSEQQLSESQIIAQEETSKIQESIQALIKHLSTLITL